MFGGLLLDALARDIVGRQATGLLVVIWIDLVLSAHNHSAFDAHI
jgi:hypothetical protein